MGAGILWDVRETETPPNQKLLWGQPSGAFVTEKGYGRTVEWRRGAQLSGVGVWKVVRRLAKSFRAATGDRRLKRWLGTSVQAPRNAGGQHRARVGRSRSPARGGGARRPGAPASRLSLPPREEAEGRGVNRAAAVMSAGHMEPLMARDGSRRAGSCGSCCCGSGGGGERGLRGRTVGSPCALRTAA